jgi:hypothetical protein
MMPYEKTAEDYIRLWNECDPALRKRLLENGWTSDATYVDPMARAAGREEISTLVGSVQQRFPGYTFKLTSKPDGHGEHLRFSWSLGPANGEAPIAGSDVVTTKGERIAGVIGFLDKLPG